jgi:hypothetical protein
LPVHKYLRRVDGRFTIDHGHNEVILSFDFILSRDGHLWRVQVKSTRTAKRGVYEISAHGCWGAHDIYTKDEIDLIVAYVVPLDVCYIIPIEATRGRKRLCLHPDVPHKACYKYEKYREAWGLLKA